MKIKLLVALLIFVCFQVASATDITISEIPVSDMPEANFETDKVVAIPNGPLYIKNLSRKMKSPGYWISKLKNPDEIIMTKDEIKQRNDKLFASKFYVTDILKYPKAIRKASFQRQINNLFAFFMRDTYLDSSLQEITKEQINKIKSNSRCKLAAKVLKTNYAIAVNYTDVRLLPTKEAFLSNKETFDIDRIQVAGLDIGEPLVVISQTRDKKWSFIISMHSDGWVQTKDIATAQPKEISDWINTKNIVVVTEPKADIFTDKECLKYYDYVRMGSKFPLISSDKDSFCIKIPMKNSKGKLYFSKAYIAKEDANNGYLPYTQRNVLHTAFKHLNSPYSWGGLDGEQDCSTFTRQIFACFGMIFPRNSSTQIRCGKHPVKINSDDSDETRMKKITENAKPGLTMLFLPGHIMLYIGQENKSPYAIHALWGTESYTNDKEISVSFTNKIIVSDLHIGKNSTKGSLLQRITKFNVLD